MDRHKKLWYMNDENKTMGHAWAVKYKAHLFSCCAWTRLGPQHGPAEARMKLHWAGMIGQA